MTYRFTLCCNRCGCCDAKIAQRSPPYWDDGIFIWCPECKLVSTANNMEQNAHASVQEPEYETPEEL